MILLVLINRLGGYNRLRTIAKESNNPIKRKMGKLLIKYLEYKTNAYLPIYNLIKGPVNFIHGTNGVFISGGAIIGKNCTIYQHVTIGSNMLVDSKGLGSPTIGDNCLLGAGAKVIGNVTIGHNCRVGSNAVVTKDVPDNTVVVSAPSLYIEKEELSNRIYQLGSTGWGYYVDGEFVVENDQDISAKLYDINNKKKFGNRPSKKRNLE